MSLTANLACRTQTPDTSSASSSLGDTELDRTPGHDADAGHQKRQAMRIPEQLSGQVAPEKNRALTGRTRDLRITGCLQLTNGPQYVGSPGSRRSIELTTELGGQLFQD